eukprot:TRINITY_DN6614_c0_g1_i1.p1 TRINITY_DN6614_c0_g1~~TRINITY_DN6614_c0_g1_i1.p1  ORF type:complete len:462 (-),score=118.55 TRINITY_DN6614_c0_g1_i1:31-1416(-)
MLFQIACLHAIVHPLPVTGSLSSFQPSIWSNLPVAAVDAVLFEIVSKHIGQILAPQHVLLMANMKSEIDSLQKKSSQSRFSQETQRWDYIISIAACALSFEKTTNTEMLFSATPTSTPAHIVSFARFITAIYSFPFFEILPKNAFSALLSISSQISFRFPQDALNMLKEVFQFVNLPPKVTEHCETTQKIKEFFSNESAGCLCFHGIKAACTTLSSVKTMALIIEDLIEGYFGFSQTPSWEALLGFFDPPQLQYSDFITECLSSGYSLTFFLSTLLQLRQGAHSADPIARSAAFHSFAAFAERLRTPTTSPIREGSFFSVIALYMRALTTDTFVASQAQQRQLAFHFGEKLVKNGETRSTKGLFGKIGLGEKSPYSFEFRLTSYSIGCFLMTKSGIPSTTTKCDPAVVESECRGRVDCCAVLAMLRDPANTLTDTPQVMDTIFRTFYPNRKDLTSSLSAQW